MATPSSPNGIAQARASRLLSSGSRPTNRTLMVTGLRDAAPVLGAPSRHARRTPTRANIQVTVALAPWSTEAGALLSPCTYTVTSAGLELSLIHISEPTR